MPVCTLSPICSSDICTDFPVSKMTRDVDGKHPPPPDGGGDGGGVVVVVANGSHPVHQQILFQ